MRPNPSANPGSTAKVRWRALMLVVVLAGIGHGFCAVSLQAAEPAPMRVHFFDVGQGDATLFEFPCGAVLVDTGGEENPAFHSDDALIAELDEFFGRRTDLKRTVDLLILTHPHLDHTRGVERLLAHGIAIENAVWNGQSGGSGWRGQKALEDFVRDEGIAYRRIRYPDATVVGARTDTVIDPIDCRASGDDGEIDPLIRVLWGEIQADPGWGYEEYYGEREYHVDNENNHSVTVRVDYGKGSVLLTGDMEAPAIRTFLTRYEGTGLLDVDVLQVGHHGSHNATTSALVTAVSPKVSVISMGPASRECKWWWRLRGTRGCHTAHAFGHPRKSAVDQLELGTSLPRRTVKEERVATGTRRFVSRDIERCVYGTGWTGTVVVSVGTNGWIDVEKPAAEPCSGSAH